MRLLVFGLIEAVSEATLSAVMAVKVAGHEHAGAALVRRTLAPKTVDFAVLVHLPRQKKKISRATAGDCAG